MIFCKSLSIASQMVCIVWLAGGVTAYAGDNTPISPHNNIELKYSYGRQYLLASLIANSDLTYDTHRSYSDILLSFNATINHHLTYSGSLELTDLPHRLIGTKYSRPDFPLSTGRFQESEFKYKIESLLITVGRANFFEEVRRPAIFIHPINGDGLSWTYKTEHVSFKHVIETLPSEKSADIVFRRLLNYHQLQFKKAGLALGAGEYFILTGENIGLDFKRLNPFVPYARNSHDSYADIYPGFSGDSDNALVNFFLSWAGKKSSLYFNLYIDEFQMDPWDRKINNDALLFYIYGEKDFSAFIGMEWPWTMISTLSVATPNFGQHPGPFTTTTSASYPLFEYSPGMLNLFYVKSDIYPGNASTISVSFHHESWVNIASISQELRNNKTALESLDVHQDFRITTGYKHNIQVLHTAIMVQAWWASAEDNYVGGNLSLIYNRSF